MTLFMAVFMLVEEGGSSIIQTVITTLVFLLNGIWLLYIMEKLLIGYYYAFVKFMLKYLPCFTKCWCCKRKSEKEKFISEDQQSNVHELDNLSMNGVIGRETILNQVINPLASLKKEEVHNNEVCNI